MVTATSDIKEEINENEAKLELYRLIGEGYKAMQEKRMKLCLREDVAHGC